ncbi:MAG: helix-turn-helix transcriptional regulator [Clostridia bacterium]|nr:helix-turn-helix transcriptional regulator [Clostridia bacterium]
MNNKESKKIKIPTINSFDFQIKYSKTDRKRHTVGIDIHAHDEFELYINLSGDVAFLVENKLYDLTRGDVVISRPGELHHCVYRSDDPHELFWILFDSHKNSEILDFLQEGFEENFISPKDELREELIELCYTFCNGSLTEEEKVYCFFRFFAILKMSKDSSKKQSAMTKELSEIIEFIDDNVCEEITVSSIAKRFFISQSALERRFKEILFMTPLEYIRRKKLLFAAKLLKDGASVLVAGTSVGYNDSSYFIELFKHYYGITPHQYKKQF